MTRQDINDPEDGNLTDAQWDAREVERAAAAAEPEKPKRVRKPKPEPEPEVAPELEPEPAPLEPDEAPEPLAE